MLLLHMRAHKLVFAISSVTVHIAHSMDSGYNQSLKTHFVMDRIMKIQNTGIQNFWIYSFESSQDPGH